MYTMSDFPEIADTKEMREDSTNVTIKDIKQEVDDTECASSDNKWLGIIKTDGEIGSSGTPYSVDLSGECSEQKFIKFEGFEIEEFSNLDHREDEDDTMPKIVINNEYVDDNIQKVLIDVKIKNEDNSYYNERIKAEEQGVASNSEDSKFIEEVESSEKIHWYHCKFCDYTSRLSSPLIDHIRLEHDETGEWYHCQLCQYKTKKRNSFLEHIELKHGRTSSYENVSVKNENLQYFYCQVCDFKTKSGPSLKEHCKIRHSDNANIYQCTSCDYRTLYKHNLKSHVSIKHCEHSEWQQCTFCYYKTRSMHSLSRHISRNHGDKVKWFRCALCKYMSKRKDNLTIHVKRQHKGVA